MDFSLLFDSVSGRSERTTEGQNKRENNTQTEQVRIAKKKDLYCSPFTVHCTLWPADRTNQKGNIEWAKEK